jgi:hypothetical protein
MGPPALGGVVLHGIRQTGGFGAVHATENVASYLYPVANDPGQAVSASRRHRLNRTLEAVECVPLTLHHNFKAFVVFVPALFTCSHRHLLQISILKTDLTLGA